MTHDQWANVSAEAIAPLVRLAVAANPAMFSTGCWTYHRKQVELLLAWAMATMNPDLKAKLLARALEFSTLVDCIDDGMLRGFQELIAEFNAQLLHKP